jgi:hypothetical protein
MQIQDSKVKISHLGQNDAIPVPEDLLFWAIENHNRPTIPEKRNMLPEAERNNVLILCLSVCTKTPMY